MKFFQFQKNEAQDLTNLDTICEHAKKEKGCEDEDKILKVALNIKVASN